MAVTVESAATACYDFVFSLPNEPAIGSPNERGYRRVTFIMCEHNVIICRRCWRSAAYLETTVGILPCRLDLCMPSMHATITPMHRCCHMTMTVSLNSRCHATACDGHCPPHRRSVRPPQNIYQRVTCSARARLQPASGNSAARRAAAAHEGDYHCTRS